MSWLNGGPYATTTFEAWRSKLSSANDQLGFLNKGRESRTTEASFENANEEAQETIRTFEGEQGTDDVTERDETQQPTPPSSAINAAQKKTKKPDVERALINFMESHKVVKEPLVDEDLAFFHSLLPSLNTLDFEQKFTFRMETMQLLRSLKNSPTHANFTHSNINAPSTSSTYVHQTTNSSLPIHSFIHASTYAYLLKPNFTYVHSPTVYEPIQSFILSQQLPWSWFTPSISIMNVFIELATFSSTTRKR